jgi:hypothetical protein
MSALLDELRSKWQEALASGRGHREWRAIALSIASPVKLLAGIRDRDDRSSILLETPLQNAPKHRVRFQAEGISLVDERWADEGLLRLAVTLERADLRQIYEVLAIDLLSVAAASRSAEIAVSEIIRRLAAWQACLRARRQGLTREEQTGLLGELLLMEYAAPHIGWGSSISCWCGPTRGIHDFEGAGVAVEVKTTIGVSHILRISRLDQLDNQGLTTLVLVRVKLHEAADGSSLPDAVGRVRRALADDHNSAMDFEDKLMHAGYLDADAELYGEIRTVLDELHGFHVSQGFPRLTAGTVSSAIVEAAYSLDERQLAPFRLDQGALQMALRQMGGSQ